VKYLLDTSTCVAVLRGQEQAVTRLAALRASDAAVSAVTVAELWLGARKSRQPALTRMGVDAFLAPLRTLAFDLAEAEAYVEARHALEVAGTPIGERDLLIAATARAHGLAVVTNNAREFGRVAGLVVEDWSR
jgi:tRNA(fMet)-specific endonuclease VapC